MNPLQKLKNLPTRKIWQALLITMAIAATIHLCIVGLVALVKQSVSYINPLDFLGISYVIPQYRESSMAALIGWIILVSLFFGVLYASIHYQFYLSIIRESKVHQTLKAVGKSIKTIQGKPRN